MSTPPKIVAGATGASDPSPSLQRQAALPMTEPLTLTTEQHALIRSAVDQVPPKFQQRFLSAGQDLLLPKSAPTNQDVVTAVRTATRMLASGPSAAVPNDKRF